MNRFLRVWAASADGRVVAALVAFLVLTAVAVVITRDADTVLIAAVIFCISAAVYSRSLHAGMDEAAADQQIANSRFLSFELASGMSRKEYVDSYIVTSSIIIPPVFVVMLVLLCSYTGDTVDGIAGALALTVAMLPLLCLVVHQNACSLAGRSEAGGFLLKMLLLILLFFIVLAGLVKFSGSAPWILLFTMLIGLPAASELRSMAIGVMMKADVRREVFVSIRRWFWR